MRVVTTTSRVKEIMSMAKGVRRRGMNPLRLPSFKYSSSGRSGLRPESKMNMEQHQVLQQLLAGSGPTRLCQVERSNVEL